MPQHLWNITGAQGNTYRLGLFHGDKTQHVVLHCNDRVFRIDFEVRESKTYSFLLDQELCEVSIDHTGAGSYDYSCRINHEAETPLNKARKQQRDVNNRRDRLQVSIGLSIVLLVMAFLLASALA